MTVFRIIPLLLMLNFMACHPPQSDVLEMELSTTDPSLARQQGMLFFQNEPFTGYLTERYPSGTLKRKTAYSNGWKSGIDYQWYANGQRASYREFLQGRKVGEHKAWWANGQLKFHYQFKNGTHHGMQKEWYENGQPARLEEYAEGIEVGLHQRWSAEGKLKTNFVVKDGRRYGRIGTKPCYTVSSE